MNMVSKRMVARPRVAVTAIAALAVIVAGVGYVLAPVRTSVIHPAYAFDASDRTLVSGYADRVVVAVITTDGEYSATADGAGQTTFSATVETTLKGSGEPSVTFGQTGVDMTGKSQTRIDGVAVLSLGERYVLALKADPVRGGLTLVAGPRSPDLLTPESATATVAAWRQAVVNQRMPDL